MTGPGFKDHFSGHAGDYAAFRPGWPPGLFLWLSRQAPGHDLAWDCATGNGQAAVSLAEHFDRVVATDASAEQVGRAFGHPRVEYRVEPAESCSLPDAGVDLVVVAQAFHWFDQAAFLREAGRVLRPGGLLALLIYQLAKVTPSVDAVIDRLYGEILDDYWPPEREQIERGLGSVVLPFADVAAPAFQIEVDWTLGQMVSYVGTWSAVRRYRKANQSDPVALVVEDLIAAWGDAEAPRRVAWPVGLRVCRRPA